MATLEERVDRIEQHLGLPPIEEPPPPPPPPSATPISELTAVPVVNSDGHFVQLGYKATHDNVRLKEVNSPNGWAFPFSLLRGPMGDINHVYEYSLVDLNDGTVYDFPPVTFQQSHPPPPPPPPPSGSPTPILTVPLTKDLTGIRTGDSGIRQWNNSGENKFEIVGGSLRVSLQDGSPNRAEGMVAKPSAPGESFKIREGDDLWFGWDMLIEPGTPDQLWSTLHQWKNDGEGSPGAGLYLQEGALAFYFHGRNRKEICPPDMGTWHRYVFHMKFSSGGSNRNSAWRDGVQLVNGHVSPVGNMYSGRESYLKIGYYRSTSNTRPGVIRYRDYRVGNSMEDVA